MNRRGLARTGTIVLLVQTAGFVALAGLGARSWRMANHLPTLPKLRDHPATVEPQFDVPSVITDEQLKAVLFKLRPKLNSHQPKINYVDHALRFWGLDASFDDPQCLSGLAMRDILMDHRQFQKYWGPDARPLLHSANGSLLMRTQQGNATSSHTDHTLGTLAEVGVALNHPVIYARGETTLRQLLEDALHRFSINQPEYEWTTIACALYSADSAAWYSQEGQEITFDRLADRLMRQAHPQGVCYGQHRLYTLTILTRLDRDRGLFSPVVRSRVDAYLTDVTRRLVQTQSADGYWDANWHEATATIRDEKLEPLSRRLSATGHALEWWAMAPREFQPPRETMVRAGQWLVREIDKLDEHHVVKNYTFLTHIGRALCLWRGQLPAAAWERLRQATVADTQGSSSPKRPSTKGGRS